MRMAGKPFHWIVLALFAFPERGRADYADIDGSDGMFVMAAIGDSITTGFNANLPLDNKSLSWSTGYSTSGKVESHYLRVKKVYTGDVYQVNVARAGAKSPDLARQLGKLKKDLKGRELDYLTVMIGANDVCTWPQNHAAQLAAFNTRVRATLDGALALNPGMKVSLVPVPDMLRLYEVGKEKGCSNLWKIFRSCSVLLLNKDPAQRAAFGERLQDLNDSLATIAAEYPQAVHFAHEVATFAFSPEDLSGKDCFHPSWKGQNKIAAYSWQGGWYDRQPQDEMLLSETASAP